MSGFEDKGRGHKPRKIGVLWKKKRHKQQLKTTMTIATTTTMKHTHLPCVQQGLHPQGHPAFNPVMQPCPAGSEAITCPYVQ